jgi:phosphatidylserine/phosphatidylglycerophosphate/cardiolipin synthase-like enzyme
MGSQVLVCISLVLVVALAVVYCSSFKALPEGISFQGERVATKELSFVADTTWIDESGQRQVEQAIFDDIFRIIAGAQKLIVLDMFLYNDFQGPIPETTRALASELTSALIARKVAQPEIDIVVITDPVNILYGGLPSPYFNRLRAAGVRVILTDLDKLRDSNALYSFFWRIFAKPFGNAVANTLPNPIGPGRVSIRSYLKVINFKANHRKVLIADRGKDYVGLVTSANPHDGSSAHRNVAIRFTGAAVADLLETENAVLAFSGEPIIKLDHRFDHVQSDTTVQVVTESKIKDAILSYLDGVGAADKVDLMMFYLSDRGVIAALKQASNRGAHLRLLLDPNKDAFGREKNGIPNRQVAHELTAANIPVRWCSSQGEQCHTKMLMIHNDSGNSVIITGSANLTRRNLADFNLETDIVIEGRSNRAPFSDARQYFEDQWQNTSERQYSTVYERYQDDSWWRRQLYFFVEQSGFSSF